MRIKKLTSLSRFYAAALLLSPCSHGHAASASYVLVTQTRPESPDKFFVHERSGYALCAAVARNQNIAVKPFPVLPPDFVSKRTTYASDGKRTVFREVAWKIDSRKGQAQQGCEMRLASESTTAVTSDGQERIADQREDGKVHVGTAQPAPQEPVRASLLGLYTVPKTVRGVALKCSASGSCIVDPALALVAHGVRPAQAASRIDDTRTYGTALILEPVSLTVGKPVDPSLFVLEKTE